MPFGTRDRDRLAQQRQDRAGPLAEPGRLLAAVGESEALATVEQTVAGRFDCRVARRLDELCSCLDREDFDLVVCDQRLAAGSELEVVEEIGRRRPETAIVLLASADDPGLAERAFQLGAHAYLLEPLQPSQLLVAALSALRGRQLERSGEVQRRLLAQPLQTLIERAPFPLYAKDRELRYLLANRAAHEAVGQPPNGMIGRRDEQIFSPDTAEVVREADLRVLRNEEPVEREETLRANGVERVYLSVKFPYVDEGGAVIGIFGVSADITANRRTEELQRELAAAQAKAIEELRSSRLETVERLSRSIEKHDAVTGRHVTRIAATASFLAHAIGLERQQVELLREAAPMHDVGKIAIADEILRKPGPLSEAERAEMQRHTVIGHELLAGSESDLLRMGARIALTHHERYDGNGYPRGLRGEEIPVEGRIVAVADVFDALLSDRPYRPAMRVAEAVEVMRRGRGTDFDPAVADALLGNLEEVLSRRG